MSADNDRIGQMWLAKWGIILVIDVEECRDQYKWTVLQQHHIHEKTMITKRCNLSELEYDFRWTRIF